MIQPRCTFFEFWNHGKQDFISSASETKLNTCVKRVFHANRRSFNVGTLFWAKKPRVMGLDPVFDHFQGPEKTPEIWKSLITPRFLQLQPNKWHHRISHQKVHLPGLFKIVSSPYETLFIAFFGIFSFFDPVSKLRFLSPFNL